MALGAPLEGLRVLELARALAGPWIGQAPTGDETRTWGPPFVDGPGGDRSAAPCHAADRGKRSVAADFRTPEGQGLVRGEAARADILIENF